jgi:hypothetical protein
MSRKKNTVGQKVAKTFGQEVADALVGLVAEVPEGCVVEPRTFEKGRALLRVHPDGSAWAIPDTFASMLGTIAEGAIVRLDPPASASDADVDVVRDAFVRAGAAAVRVSDRQRDAVVVDPETKVEIAAPRDVRAIVRELVDAANVEDREALRELCEVHLSKAGL